MRPGEFSERRSSRRSVVLGDGLLTRCFASFLKEPELSAALHVSQHIHSGAGEEKTPRGELCHTQRERERKRKKRTSFI